MDKNVLQSEILERLPPNPHGILNLSMRIGKTKIILDLIQRDKPLSVLWVTVSTELRDKGIPDEFRKWGREEDLKKTTIICWASLHMEAGNYDLIVLDEVQKITLANAKSLFKISYKNIVGMTGTLPKDEDKKHILQSLGLGVLETVGLEKAIDLNVVSDYNLYVIEVELEEVEKNVVGGTKLKPFMTTERAKYNFLCGQIDQYKNRGQSVPFYLTMNRARYIYTLPSKVNFAKELLNTLQGRKIIFSGSTKMADDLHPNSYHSKKKDKEESLTLFEKEVENTLSCVNSGGIGKTFYNIDHLIVTSVNSNQNGDVTQKVGRALVPRDCCTPNIILLVAKDTQDEVWVSKVLKDFDITKVKKLTIHDYRKYGL